MNIVSYIEYVTAILDNVKVPVGAAYDTGFAMHLVGEDVGNTASPWDIMGSIARIVPPLIDDTNEWDAAWSEAKRLVKARIERDGNIVA